MLTYYGDRISPHMTTTPEGFLICHDVPIARTGDMDYLSSEIGLSGDGNRLVRVHRYEEDVFSPDAMASFEGKEVTCGHPPEFVGPENYSAYSKGHIRDVRRSGDYLVADLYIKDAALINDVRNGVLREVSCGYHCSYIPDGNGYRQQNIRGNHVAVVPSGRAGHEVAIHDSAHDAGKGSDSMNENETKTAPAAEPEKPETAPAPEAPTADAAPSALDEKIEKMLSAQNAKFDRLISLLEVRDSKPEQPEGAQALDQMISSLEGVQPEKTVIEGQARDAALSVLRTMRPVVASIEDAATQKRVTDALLSAVKGQDTLGGVMQAVQQNAQQAADAARASTFEAICRESEAAYAARNPHKKKED